jgi:hypothetical protein
MMLMMFYKAGMLFTAQLIALISAVFLFVYIKKHSPEKKWFVILTMGIIGLVFLTMTCTFLGVVYASTCKPNFNHSLEKNNCFYKSCANDCENDKEMCIHSSSRNNCKKTSDCFQYKIETSCCQKTSNGNKCCNSEMKCSKDTLVECKGAKK